jgi:hypothetical protein
MALCHGDSMAIGIVEAAQAFSPAAMLKKLLKTKAGASRAKLW